MKRGWMLVPVAAVSIVATLVFSTAARSTSARFFHSLRMAPPARVNVGITAAAGPYGNRSLQQLLSDMAASKVDVVSDEGDQPVASASAASQAAGFIVQLPQLRKDAPKLTVIGAHAVRLYVDRSRLQTMLDEAGRSHVILPSNTDGSVVSVRDPKAIRVEYGNCPQPDNTLQGQITGPPPPSTDTSNCLVLLESPDASIHVPGGIDLQPLVEIGLQLSGMNPKQTEDFLSTFDWKKSLALALPRFVRAYELVDIRGAKGMLLSTAGRRGPTYGLIWTRNGMIYSLTGYGNTGEAIPLAESIP